MSQNDKLNIESVYSNNIYLGSVMSISVILKNMILSNFDSILDVKFSSLQFGTYNLERQYNSTYQTNIFVPESSDFYPYIEGYVQIYKNLQLIHEELVKINTTFVLNIESKLVSVDKLDKKDVGISFELYITYLFNSGNYSASNSTVWAEIYDTGGYLYEKSFFYRENIGECSKFSHIFYYPKYYDLEEDYPPPYRILVYIKDEFHNDELIYDMAVAPGMHRPITHDTATSISFWVWVIIISSIISVVIGTIVFLAKKNTWVKDRRNKLDNVEKLETKMMDKLSPEFIDSKDDDYSSFYENLENEDGIDNLNINSQISSEKMVFINRTESRPLQDSSDGEKTPKKQKTLGLILKFFIAGMVLSFVLSSLRFLSALLFGGAYYSDFLIGTVRYIFFPIGTIMGLFGVLVMVISKKNRKKGFCCILGGVLLMFFGGIIVIVHAFLTIIGMGIVAGFS